MPPLEVATNGSEEAATTNPVVGIIYPPPEVRSILCSSDLLHFKCLKL